MWLNEERCAITFVSDRANDDRTASKKSSQKSDRHCIVAKFDGSNFVETCGSPHWKRLASCARTYLAMGYNLYPRAHHS